ncbi:hypothetical protein [Profundibacterium mesophilum]|uniref:Integrase n=1 Tax=Profundibacterium mesophilum KAUST100406-0324 TaxID=1037889 RepID=A0A921NPC2_9RHOB|nr:hypothetical protein [Profundibacterium mesophilum]KAF0674480.1 Integrase [Profundibacterium mesophilum KAUST100406-0324]
MASFRKMAGGRWRAEVARQGRRSSKVFPTKAAAREWAARQEYLIETAVPAGEKTLFRDVLARYADEVSPRKRGERWEIMRLRRMRQDRIAEISMSKLAPAHFADWRDRRLREVSAGSVIREMVLLSAVLSIARREWGLIAVNPMADVRKPPNV